MPPPQRPVQNGSSSPYAIPSTLHAAISRSAPSHPILSRSVAVPTRGRARNSFGVSDGAYVQSPNQLRGNSSPIGSYPSRILDPHRLRDDHGGWHQVRLQDPSRYTQMLQPGGTKHEGGGGPANVIGDALGYVTWGAGMTSAQDPASGGRGSNSNGHTGGRTGGMVTDYNGDPVSSTGLKLDAAQWAAAQEERQRRQEDLDREHGRHSVGCNGPSWAYLASPDALPDAPGQSGWRGGATKADIANRLAALAGGRETGAVDFQPSRGGLTFLNSRADAGGNQPREGSGGGVSMKAFPIPMGDPHPDAFRVIQRIGRR